VILYVQQLLADEVVVIKEDEILGVNNSLDQSKARAQASSNSAEQQKSISRKPLPSSPTSVQSSLTGDTVENLTSKKLLGWRKLLPFPFSKNPWPDPHLSIGTKCDRLGGNECWEAIGPAQELFSKISKSVADLLDTRIEDVEEGEPVAGHILTFGMFMIGKSVATAQPTLLFICQRLKPRRRAIKFVKESGILKDHPKFALAESAMCPLAAGNGYLRLLTVQARSLLPGIAPRFDQTTQTLPSNLYRRGTSVIVGASVGGGVIVVLVIFAVSFFVLRRRRKLASLVPGLVPEPPHAFHYRNDTETNKHWVKDWLRRSAHPENEIVSIEMGDLLGPVFERPSEDYSLSPITPFPNLFPVFEERSRTILERQGRQEMGSLRSPPEIGPTSFPKLMTPPLYAPAVTSTSLAPQKHSQHRTTETSKFSSGRSLATDFLGVPIFCTSTGRRATLGGIICSKDRHYGLTVAHAFADNPQSKEDTSLNDESGAESEFAFDQDDEEITNNESTLTPVAYSSPPSLTDAMRRFYGKSIASPAQPVVLHNPTSPTTQNSTIMGHLSESSILGMQLGSDMQLGLDWAIVKLSESAILDARTSRMKNKSSKNVALSGTIIPKLENAANILAYTGYNGVVKGTISPSTTMMRLSPRSNFQEVWTVRLDSPLSKYLSLAKSNHIIT